MAPRDPVGDGEIVTWGRYQQMWFVVAGGQQAYIGTLAMAGHGNDTAFLLASRDEERLLRTLALWAIFIAALAGIFYVTR